MVCVCCDIVEKNGLFDPGVLLWDTGDESVDFVHVGYIDQLSSDHRGLMNIKYTWALCKNMVLMSILHNCCVFLWYLIHE